MDLPEEAKRAPSAPVWNQSFPSPYSNPGSPLVEVRRLGGGLHSLSTVPLYNYYWFVWCRWLALPSQKDFVSLALSNSACQMLRVLKDHLHQMQTLLSKSLFNDFWQHLASRLNDYFLTEVKSANTSSSDLHSGRRHKGHKTKTIWMGKGFCLKIDYCQ